MDASQQKDYLELAQKAALAAGQLQLEALRGSFSIEIKSTALDLVTSVDRECDRLISELLTAHCPQDSLLTEETYQEGSVIDLSRTWVVDPIDGTTNFAHKFPHFAVSIAYFEQGIAQIGVVYDPSRQEMFYALRGRGAFLTTSHAHDVPLGVSNVPKLSHALLATGFPYDIADSADNNLENFSRLVKRCHGVRRPGAAALDLAYVAAGRLDGFWEPKLSPWDVAAGGLLVEEAGGRMTDFHQQLLNYEARRLNIVATNGQGLHDEIASAFSPETQPVPG